MREVVAPILNQLVTALPRALGFSLDQIPQIFDFAIEGSFAFGFAAVGVDLGGGETKDQDPRVFGQAQDEGVGVFFEEHLRFRPQDRRVY